MKTLTDTNATLVNLAAAHRVFFVVLLLAIPTAYVIDVTLLGPVAEFLAGEGFPEDAFIVRYAAFIVPAMILSLEMVVAAFRLAAYREHLAGETSRASFVTLTAFAGLLAVFIPAAGVAVFLESSEQVPADWLPLLILLLPMALPVALSLTCHLCILLGARRMHEAKAWLAFLLHRSVLVQQQEAARRVFARESQGAADQLVVYLQARDEYNAAYAPQIPAGPFEKNTREIVNEVFGYEVIQTGTAGQTAPPPRQATPSNDPPPPAPEPEVQRPGEPDWTTFQNRRVREDESEVRA